MLDSEPKQELYIGDDKEYEVEAICDSKLYTIKTIRELLGL